MRLIADGFGLPEVGPLLRPGDAVDYIRRRVGADGRRRAKDERAAHRLIARGEFVAAAGLVERAANQADRTIGRTAPGGVLVALQPEPVESRLKAP